MDKLYDLKEMLCEELEKYGTKELTAGNLEIIDKLAHATKNISKILEGYDDSYSNAQYGGMSYERGNTRDGNRSNAMDRRSYARGRGRNARRDAMGRYSSEGYSMALAEDLREMMMDAPDEQTRQDIQRIVTRLERS